jgi:hypothetical protein
MPGQLSYNGIILDICKIKSSRKTMMEGPNYLYTRHIIHCKAIYNRGATAYVRGANGPIAVMPNFAAVRDSLSLIIYLHGKNKGPGADVPKNDFQNQVNQVGLAAAVAAQNKADAQNFRFALQRDPVDVDRFIVPNIDFADAPTTDVAIRHYLSLPRKKLIHVVGIVPVLISPWTQDPDITVDCNNGPTPLYCNVDAIHGQKTFEVEFVVQTDINERRIYKTPKTTLEARPPVSQDGSQLTAASGPSLLTFGARAARPVAPDGGQRQQWAGNPIAEAQDQLLEQLILSNVYAQEDDVDENFFLTRSTRGRAILNTMVLQALDLRKVRIGNAQLPPLPPFLQNIVPGFIQNFAAAAFAGGQQALFNQAFTGDPDIVRLGITRLIPVPPYCKRENLRFAVDEHNNSIVYSFMDRELAYNIVTSVYPNITDVKVTQTRFSYNPDQFQVLTSQILGSLEGAMRGGQAVGTQIASAVGAGVGGFLGWHISATIPNNMPHFGTALVIEIWGNHQCQKQEMLDAANHILKSQVNRAASILQGIQNPAAFQNFINNIVPAGGAGDIAGQLFNKILPENLIDKFKNLVFTGRVKVNTTFELTGKHLVLMAEYQQSVFGAILNQLNSKVPALVPSADFFGEGDDNADVRGVYVDNPLEPMPAPPGDGFSGKNPSANGGSRGLVLDPLVVRHPWHYDHEQDEALQPAEIPPVQGK